MTARVIEDEEARSVIRTTRERYRGRLVNYAKELRRIADAIDRQVATGSGLYGSEGANLATMAANLEGTIEGMNVLIEIGGRP